nr:hypothetical protein [uncultured Caproiciproducens sp.]
MSYYVSLGGINIAGVKDISLTSGRDMQEYDGIENGKFSVPESENLREWTISCELSVKNIHKFDHWQAAGYVFTAFETMLKTKDYSRFVSVSSTENISELVRLKQYTKKEKYGGVYDVEITVQEYKAVAIKTTGVPYIARPGKVPVPPKVTITPKNTVYSATKKIVHTGAVADFKKLDYKDVKTGKPVTNPAAVKAGTTYIVSTPKSVSSINSSSSATGTSVSAIDQLKGIKDVAVGVGEVAGKAWSAISSAFNKFGASVESWSKTLK